MAQTRSISRRRRRSGEAGVELIEFALVFPLLLLVVLGIVDYGFMFQRFEALTNATREGARVASLPGYAQVDIEDDGTVKIYWGGADTVMCAGTARLESLVEMCLTNSRNPM